MKQTGFQPNGIQVSRWWETKVSYLTDSWTR